MTLKFLASDMNKGRKSGELEDNGAKVGDKEDDQGTGNCLESMELDCKPYVDEGGPSNNDTETAEKFAKQKSYDTETKEAIAKQKSVTKKKKRTDSVNAQVTGARKSTRTRRVTARY